MTRVLNKVVVMGVVAIMLFSVFAFGAGHCVMYDPRVAELQRRIEELEEENRVLRLELRRFEAIRELGEFFDEFDEEDYHSWQWNRIVAYFEIGITSIDEAVDINEVNSTLKTTKENIYNVPYESFVLRILEDYIIAYYGECIWVNVEFVNQTGMTVWVYSFTWFDTHVPSYVEFPSGNLSGDGGHNILENNEILRFRNNWSCDYCDDDCFDYPYKSKVMGRVGRGVHELSFHLFFSAWCYEDANNFHRPMTSIWSNSILLTII